MGKDAAHALGYSNPRKALADHVDAEDKGVTKRDTPGGSQEMTIINESGLYSLVLGSKLPGAKKFKRRVIAEVLLSVPQDTRKHRARRLCAFLYGSGYSSTISNKLGG